MNQHHNDEFDDKKLSDLYRQGATEKPSDNISHKILSAASEQAKLNRSGPNLIEYLINMITSSRSLAFAAVMVIGISIILQIQFDQPEQIVPQSISDSIPAATMKPDSTEILAEPENFSEPMDSASDLEKSISKSLSPAKPVTKADEKRRNESDRKAQSEAKRRMAEENQLMRQRSQEKKEKRMMLAPENAFSPAPVISPLTSTLNCDELTNRACLSSAKCTLSFHDNNLTCQSTVNHCEKGFVQMDMYKEQCEQKTGCQYITGHCNCDADESCSCINDELPSCEPIKRAE